MKSARIVPEQKDGKVVGIRMFGIRPETLLGTLGFRTAIVSESSTVSTWRARRKRSKPTRGLRTAQS